MDVAGCDSCYWWLLCTLHLFLSHITPFLPGNPTSTPSPGELSVTVPLSPGQMDEHILQTTDPGPLVTVAGLRGGHVSLAGCFYMPVGKKFSLEAKIAYLAGCMDSHLPIPKEQANTSNKLTFRGSRSSRC